MLKWLAKEWFNEYSFCVIISSLGGWKMNSSLRLQIGAQHGYLRTDRLKRNLQLYYGHLEWHHFWVSEMAYQVKMLWLTTQVQSLELTQWEKKTNSCEVSFDLYM